MIVSASFSVSVANLEKITALAAERKKKGMRDANNSRIVEEALTLYFRELERDDEADS